MSYVVYYVDTTFRGITSERCRLWRQHSAKSTFIAYTLNPAPYYCFDLLRYYTISKAKDTAPFQFRRRMPSDDTSEGHEGDRLQLCEHPDVVNAVSIKFMERTARRQPLLGHVAVSSATTQ